MPEGCIGQQKNRAGMKEKEQEPRLKFKIYMLTSTHIKIKA
jgi:hypothetical protein